MVNTADLKSAGETLIGSIPIVSKKLAKKYFFLQVNIGVTHQNITSAGNELPAEVRTEGLGGQSPPR